MTPEVPTATAPGGRALAPAPRPRPPRIWRRRWLLAWLNRHRWPAYLALGALALAAAGRWGYVRSHHVTENDARVRADLITVSSRVDGWVTERLVTDGEPIHRDQVLAVIDQRETLLRLAELRAKAESVRLQRARAATQLRMVEVTAPDAVTTAAAHGAAAAARRRASASQLAQARRDFERADAVVDRLVSRERWDQRRTQLREAEEADRSAAADLSAAEAALADARARLGDVDVLRKELEVLAQDAAQIDAQLRAREIDVADRRVHSPIDGVVDQKFVQPGEYVIPRQRLFVIHDPKGVWIDADVKETKLAGLRPGQPVDIRVDAYPDRSFTGRVERIGNAATSEFALIPSPNPSGNFTKIAQRVPVRIAVEQPADDPLRPGMMVEIDVDTARR